MLKKWHIIAILVIGILSIGIFSSFAEDQWTNPSFRADQSASRECPDCKVSKYHKPLVFSVTLSGEKYNVISGNVIDLVNDTVKLEILHQGYYHLWSGQAEVENDKTFTYTIPEDEVLWMKNGEYVLRASYGDVMAEYSFNFWIKPEPVANRETGILEVVGSHGFFDVNYIITIYTEIYDAAGMTDHSRIESLKKWPPKIKDMFVDPYVDSLNSDITLLHIILDTRFDGLLTLDLPSTDDSFTISIFGEEIPYKKIASDKDSTTITIEFEEFDEDIPIIIGGHFIQSTNPNEMLGLQDQSWMLVSDDTMRKDIFIKQSFQYVDRLGYLHIIGEVVNNKDQTINFVKVTGSLYEAHKNFIDSSFTFTTLDTIPPYTKSPFDIIFTGGSLGIDSYNLQVEYLLSNPLPMKLLTVKPFLSEDELGYFHLKGEILNTGEQTAHYVKVAGSIYDSFHKLIGTGFTYTTMDSIYPNQSSPYDLIFSDVFDKPTSSQIYAESIEYDMYYLTPKANNDLTPVDTVVEKINQENKTILLKCGEGTIEKNGECVSLIQEKSGCLIATATFGSELSPQVQQLRELRDNTLLQTESGSAFMSGFNQFYYSFSPTIADWERQNPIFKEAVKIGITPLLTSLSLLNYVHMDSEAKVLGYGIILILLNIGMYIVAPIGMFIVSRKFY